MEDKIVKFSLKSHNLEMSLSNEIANQENAKKEAKGFEARSRRPTQKEIEDFIARLKDNSNGTRENEEENK